MTFDHCRTLDELVKAGPVEQPEMGEALATLGRSDMATARMVAQERLRCGTIAQTVERALPRLS